MRWFTGAVWLIVVMFAGCGTSQNDSGQVVSPPEGKCRADDDCTLGKYCSSPGTEPAGCGFCYTPTELEPEKPAGPTLCAMDTDCDGGLICKQDWCLCDGEEQLGRAGTKVLAVEFYASWCKPCMEAVPKWKTLLEKQRRNGFHFSILV